jgi:hypothetical protein
MATFSTSAEVLTPVVNPLKKDQGRVLPRGFVLADVLRQAGGTYQTTIAMSRKFRDCIRAVATLTSDDELFRIAELSGVRVPLENCRQLDPQTHVAMVCRLEVSRAETPRWRRVDTISTRPWPRGELRILDMCQGARFEERTLPDGTLFLVRPAEPSIP